MKNLFIFTTIIILAGLVYIDPSFASGLENLEGGLKRGTTALQRVGYVVGSLMFIIGAIVMKFNADRGKQVLIGSVVGIVLLSIGIALPETLRSFFQ